MESTARLDTSFDKDVKTYGPIGERWFLELLKKSPKTIEAIDVSAAEALRPFDVDVIQLKEGSPYTNGSLPIDAIADIFRKREFLNENETVAYEVKSDTQIARTRNIAYEVMSHTNVGCAARTMANYIVYTAIDEATMTVTEAYLIPTRKLRRFVLENFGKINKEPYIRSTFMSHKQDKAAILLINVDELISQGIAKKIL